MPNVRANRCQTRRPPCSSPNGTHRALPQANAFQWQPLTPRGSAAISRPPRLLLLLGRPRLSSSGPRPQRAALLSTRPCSPSPAGRARRPGPRSPAGPGLCGGRGAVATLRLKEPRRLLGAIDSGCLSNGARREVASPCQLLAVRAVSVTALAPGWC